MGARLPGLAQLGSDLPVFGAATIIYQAGRLALNLAAARVLAPELFGVWTLIALVITYSNLVTLGITNGAGRDIPFLRGGQRLAEAHHVEDVAFAGTVVAGLAAAAATVLLGPLVIPDFVADRTAAVLFLALAVFLQQLFLLQQILFRSSFRFKEASAQLALLGVAAVVVGIPLLMFGLAGIVLAQVFIFALGLLLATRLLEHTPRPAIDGPLARRLVEVGFPIMSAGLLFGVLTTVDRWIVLTFLGLVAVGYYGLVGVTINGLLLLPAILSQQFYPRMAFAHGEHVGRKELYRLARTQSVAAGMVTVAAVFPVGLAAWFGIPLLLPKYTPSIEPLLVTLVGLVVFAFGTGYGNLMNTVGAHRWYLVVQALSLVVNVAVSVFLVHLGLGIVGVALGTSVGMLCYSGLLQSAARVWADGVDRAGIDPRP